ncbi:MAG TPA: glucosaminidase domain-containing protein [Gammaproteobacteria bacterium]|nr:glucosaminidase domain-containing protein [Gammaproteobacteria bacterium]
MDSRSFLYTLAAAVPIIAAGLIVWWHQHAPRPILAAPANIALIVIRPSSAEALQNIFTSQDYAWPPQDAVPPYAITSLPYGLGTLDNEAKKTVFFRALLPIVLAENQRILSQRTFLLEQFGRGAINRDSDAGRGLGEIAARYRVDGDLNAPRVRDLLLRRVDMVPVALVLAQAAQESGWGTSRFALEANNLFGIWTWDEDAGAAPLRRRSEASHFVRIYPDVRSSVRAYLHNINIGFAYREFRTLRASLRAQGKPLDPLLLAGTLERYSTAGELYVANIRTMIRSNDLGKLGNLSLATPRE